MRDHETNNDGLRPTRRQAMKGIAGAGAVLWSVPTLQAISMTAAHADSPSVPADTTPPDTVAGAEASRPAPTVAGAQSAPGTILPQTGASDSTVIAGVAGAAAVGIGAAAVHSSRQKTENAES